jgi:hypothetical protein
LLTGSLLLLGSNNHLGEECSRSYLNEMQNKSFIISLSWHLVLFVLYFCFVGLLSIVLLLLTNKNSILKTDFTLKIGRLKNILDSRNLVRQTPKSSNIKVTLAFKLFFWNVKYFFFIHRKSLCEKRNHCSTFSMFEFNRIKF